MPVKIYNRETKQFEIVEPKLFHIGKLTAIDNNNTLSYNDKERIYNFVEKVKLLGYEFGSRNIISTSKVDIFKIHDEFKCKKEADKEINVSNKKQISIDIIREQLGL